MVEDAVSVSVLVSYDMEMRNNKVLSRLHLAIASHFLTSLGNYQHVSLA